MIFGKPALGKAVLMWIVLNNMKIWLVHCALSIMLTIVSCLVSNKFITLVSVCVRRNSYSAHLLVFFPILDSYNSLANVLYIKRLFSVDSFFFNSYISHWVALEIANNFFL